MVGTRDRELYETAQGEFKSAYTYSLIVLYTTLLLLLGYGAAAADRASVQLSGKEWYCTNEVYLF